MSKLRLNGTSSGYVEIAAAPDAANNTITLPSDTGSIIVQSTTGITSFASAPVVIGTGTSTGTADQTLQVTGGAYVSGNVGLGVTNPTFINNDYDGLHVNATNGTILKLSNSTTGTTGSDGFDLIVGTGSSIAYVWQRENSDLVFGTNATEKLRILSAGGLTFNGDTAAANALDDYEEGTWTPLLSAQTPGTSSYTPTSNANGGHYIKIGRMVYYSGNLRGSWTLGTASGYLYVYGLPFTSSAASTENGWNSIYTAVNIPYHSGFVPDTGYVITGGMVQPSSNFFVVYQVQTASAANPSLGITRVTAGTDTVNVHFSGIYLVP